jgi:hypothetical protein
MTTNNQLVILDKTSYINNKNVSNVFNILWQKYRFEYWDLHFQAVNVINNSYNHINEILSYIYKLKDGDTKKYTLRNYHEYNIIKNILKNNHRYNFELVKTNIKKYIRYHSCIKNFDYNKPIIKNIIYIKVLKKTRKHFYKEIYPYLKNYLPDEIIMYITFYLI